MGFGVVDLLRRVYSILFFRVAVFLFGSFVRGLG